MGNCLGILGSLGSRVVPVGLFGVRGRGTNWISTLFTQLEFLSYIFLYKLYLKIPFLY